MQVFVTRARDGRVMTFEVEGDWTVAQLKDAVAAHEHGAPVERQRVFLNAMELLGARKLAEYGVNKEAEMKLIEREAMPHADEQGSTTVELAKIAGMGDGLAAGWAELSEDKRRLMEAQQALAQANMPEDGKLRKKLKINVGGTLFKNVKRETLCIVPESNLAKLFSGRWERSLLRDKDGNPFLDLPPDCFSEIMTFLGDRKLRPEDPIALPAVSEEQELTLNRLLDHLGLGHLFQEDAEPAEEGAEPEPELDAGGAEPAEAPLEGVPPVLPAQEKELIVADGDEVNLPARSVKSIVAARFGSLEEDGGWSDVTRVIGDAVDEEGGLELRASAVTLGCNPAPDAEDRQLLIRYKPCDSWEHESFADALARLQKTADAERASLRRQRKIQRDAELDFEEEKVWVKRYLKAEEGGARPAVPEVVELSVGAVGERLTVRHSTLMLCPESALARQFDAEVWGAAATAGDDDDDSDDSDDDDDDDEGVSIEADPYCFRKLVDQLRMRAIAEAGDPPPSPVVTKSKEDPFARLLDYYFPGELRSFVLSEGEHRQPGTKRKAEQGCAKGHIIIIKAWGGGGGGGQHTHGNHGGAGGYAEAAFKLQDGEVLSVTVGGGGQGKNSGKTEPDGGTPNGGSGRNNYTSGGGGGSSHVVSKLHGGEVVLGAGGGGGGTGGQHNSPGGGGGGGTANGRVGRGADPGNEDRASSPGHVPEQHGGGKAGQASRLECHRQGASANGAGGKTGNGRGAEGGHGGAASFKHIEDGSNKVINATTEAAVNTADPHAGGGHPGAGGQHGGNPGGAGRVVLIIDGHPHVYDKPGNHVFEL